MTWFTVYNYQRLYRKWGSELAWSFYKRKVQYRTKSFMGKLPVIWFHKFNNQTSFVATKIIIALDLTFPIWPRIQPYLSMRLAGFLLTPHVNGPLHKIIQKPLFSLSLNQDKATFVYTFSNLQYLKVGLLSGTVQSYSPLQ